MGDGLADGDFFDIDVGAGDTGGLIGGTDGGTDGGVLLAVECGKVGDGLGADGDAEVSTGAVWLVAAPAAALPACAAALGGAPEIVAAAAAPAARQQGWAVSSTHQLSASIAHLDVRPQSASGDEHLHQALSCWNAANPDSSPAAAAGTDAPAADAAALTAVAATTTPSPVSVHYNRTALISHVMCSSEHAATCRRVSLSILINVCNAVCVWELSWPRASHAYVIHGAISTWATPVCIVWHATDRTCICTIFHTRDGIMKLQDGTHLRQEQGCIEGKVHLPKTQQQMLQRWLPWVSRLRMRTRSIAWVIHAADAHPEQLACGVNVHWSACI